MPVPYTFGNATSSIPLSQLDNNFATPITIGNTAVQLGNTITTINNLSLANVTISSVSTPITPAQGGTGLSSPGTSANVLTSNGTAWVSQAPAAATGNVTIGNVTISLGGSASNIGNLALANTTVTAYTETLYAPAAGSSFSVNLSNGTIQEFSLNANGTITLPSSVAGKSFVIIVTYSGSYTLTWAGGSTLKWAGGTAPTATSTSGKYDIFTFFQDGTNTYGQAFGLNF